MKCQSVGRHQDLNPYIRRNTCHFTDFGLCKASLIEHLSVTELPAWAWISGLPSMVTTGTGKKKRKFNWTNLWEVRQTLIRIFRIWMYVLSWFSVKKSKATSRYIYLSRGYLFRYPLTVRKLDTSVYVHQNWDTLVFFTRFFV